LMRQGGLQAMFRPWMRLTPNTKALEWAETGGGGDADAKADQQRQ
jgi:hypothetical protein